MKKIFILFTFILLLGCSKTPITGRSQLIIVDKQEVLAQSEVQYNKVISESIIVQDERSVRIKRIGNNISRAVEEFLLSDPRYANLIKDYDWEFNLIESEQINAWCMPGGKVAFYTGILNYAETDDEIAVVMGHEIAHAVADHGRERMSQELIKQLGKDAISEVIAADSEIDQDLFLQVYGAGSGLVTLGYSREHEKEADKLGVIFMAIAGYDSSKAISFWEKMSKDGAEPIEFLSTHPNSSTRIKLISEYIESEEFKKYVR